MLLANGNLVDIFCGEVILEPSSSLGDELDVISAHLALSHATVRGKRPVL